MGVFNTIMRFLQMCMGDRMPKRIKKETYFLGVATAANHVLGWIFNLLALYMFWKLNFGSQLCDYDDSVVEPDQAEDMLKNCTSRGVYYAYSINYTIGSNDELEITYYRKIPWILALEAVLYCLPVSTFGFFMKASVVQLPQLVNSLLEAQDGWNTGGSDYKEEIKGIAQDFIRIINAYRECYFRRLVFPVYWISVKIFHVLLGIINSYFLYIVGGDLTSNIYFSDFGKCKMEHTLNSSVPVPPYQMTFYCNLPLLPTAHWILFFMKIFIPLTTFLLCLAHIASIVLFVCYSSRCFKQELQAHPGPIDFGNSEKGKKARSLLYDEDVLKSFKEFLGTDGMLALEFLSPFHSLNFLVDEPVYHEFLTNIFVEYVDLIPQGEQNGSEMSEV